VNAGVALAERITELKPGIPVLYMTDSAALLASVRTAGAGTKVNILVEQMMSSDTQVRWRWGRRAQVGVP